MSLANSDNFVVSMLMEDIMIKEEGEKIVGPLKALGDAVVMNSSPLLSLFVASFLEGKGGVRIM